MNTSRPIRVVFLGAGAFGVPSLKMILDRYEVPLVLSQPDRPAGRGRSSTPTPISGEIESLGAEAPELLRVEDVNTPETISRIHELKPDVMLVIAFGQKLGPELLANQMAINLHASLLPRWRGAAPINRAMMAGDDNAGVSIISLASRMDAGDVHAVRSTPVDPEETAGELHDRLAELGVEAVAEVIDSCRTNPIVPRAQDESDVTAAHKLSKKEATVSFHQAASAARAKIHGLTPWPGCDVVVDGMTVRLKRVRNEEWAPVEGVDPGTLLSEGRIACREGALRLLEVQPPGKGIMTWEAFQRGRSLPLGSVFSPFPERDT